MFRFICNIMSSTEPEYELPDINRTDRPTNAQDTHYETLKHDQPRAISSRNVVITVVVATIVVVLCLIGVVILLVIVTRQLNDGGQKASIDSMETRITSLQNKVF